VWWRDTARITHNYNPPSFSTAHTARAQLLALLGAALTVTAQKANLLVAKELVNAEVVEDREVIISYTFINTGNGPATGVTLTDEDITSGAFTVVSDLDSAVFASVPAGETVVATATLKPTFAIQKFHNFTTAKVSYKASADEPAQTGVTSTPGQFKVLASGEWARQNASHLVEWFVFLMLASLPVGVPYMLMEQARATY
jgi:hypothetical protein